MLRQAENRVKIEGILSEIDLKYGSYVKNGSPVEYIGGSIKVLVEQNVNGTVITNDIPVHMFANKYKNNGDPNPAYNSVEKVAKEFVSIAACGSRDLADKVRITNANLRMNDFYSQSGTLISQPQVSASFVSKAIGEFKPEATFTMEFMVSELHRVTDREGMEVDPAKLEVTVVVPQYGGRVDVCKLYATNPNVISAVEGYWESGSCYKANGRLNFTSSTEVVKEEVDFGEPVERIRTINVSEFIITGGSQVALDEEFAFSVEDIRQAMAERKVRLEESKNKANTRKTPAPNTTKGPVDLGF